MQNAELKRNIPVQTIVPPAFRCYNVGAKNNSTPLLLKATAERRVFFSERRMVMEELDLLKDLHIHDFSQTKEQLEVIGHLGVRRFANYAIPLRECTFQEVCDRYALDKKLRQSVFSIIQEIEIDLNTKITSHLTRTYGPLCYQNIFAWCQSQGSNSYLKYDSIDRRIIDQEQKQLINTITRLPNREKADDKSLLELSQFISLGELSHILKLMSKRNRKTIAENYGCSAHELISWLDCIILYRNCCCHNGDLIDICIETRPPTPRFYADCLFRLPNTQTTTNRFALGCVVLLQLARTVNVDPSEISTLSQDILNLVHGSISLEAYGFKNIASFNSAFDR